MSCSNVCNVCVSQGQQVKIELTNPSSVKPPAVRQCLSPNGLLPMGNRDLPPISKALSVGTGGLPYLPLQTSCFRRVGKKTSKKHQNKSKHKSQGWCTANHNKPPSLREHSSPNGEHETAFPLKLRSSHATDDSGRSSSWQQPMTTSSTSKYLQSCKSIWLLLELLSESFATFRSYDPCLPESPNELAHFRASTNELQLQWHLRKLPGFFSDMRYRGKQDDTCSPPWN